MNEKKRYWIIAAILGVALLLIASFTTANWYQNRTKVAKPKTSSENFSDSLTAAFNKNLDNVSAEDVVNRFLYRENEITKNLSKELKHIEVSENGSMDYLKGMLSLNEGAALLSESYLSYGGNNEPFKQFIQQALTALQDETRKIKGLKEKYSMEEHKNADMENAYLTDFNALVSELEKSEKTDSSSLEHAYAGALIRYDQMAMDMSTSIMEYTDYSEIITLAQKIIDERKLQIDELNKLAP